MFDDVVLERLEIWGAYWRLSNGGGVGGLDYPSTNCLHHSRFGMPRSDSFRGGGSDLPDMPGEVAEIDKIVNKMLNTEQRFMANMLFIARFIERDTDKQFDQFVWLIKHEAQQKKGVSKTKFKEVKRDLALVLNSIFDYKLTFNPLIPDYY